MVNWKELGEVPDSEEEGFDGTESDTTLASRGISKQVSVGRTKDIWDFPDSQEEVLPEPLLEAGPLLPVPRNLRLPSSSPLSSVLSSALSSALSEPELPSVGDVTILGRRKLINDSISSELGDASPKSETTAHKQNSLPLTNDPVVESANLFREQRSTSPLQTAYLGPSTSNHNARQIAVRYERSLRPRKPIQEHPYLLESAQYSKLFKNHGVQPLRIPDNRERRSDASKKHSSVQGGTRESSPCEARVASQMNRSYGSSSDLDDLEIPSSPPRTSPAARNLRSSQMSSQGESDNTSVPDQDLPALDDLLKLPPRLISKTAKKRRVSSPSTTTRTQKKNKVNIAESGTAEPSTILSGNLHTPNLLKTPLHPIHHHSSIHQSAASQTHRSHFQAEPSHIGTLPLPTKSVAYISSDDEEDTQSRDVLTCSNDSSSLDDSENDEEVVHHMRRHIKGVLPASWVRIDQQSTRNRTQGDVRKRRRHQSPDQDRRRGVAKTRKGVSGLATVQALYDESDDEGDGHGAPAERDELLREDELSRDSSLQTISQLIISDDQDSVVEDDQIDYMLPGKSRTTHQLKLPKSYKQIRNRRRETIRLERPGLRKESRQPKFTSHSHQKRGKDRPKRYRNTKASNKAKPSVLQPGQRRISGIPSPPQLSILDVIEPNAPRFLKIAARTAKTRPCQGRSSPGRKTIQLATRHDHIDAASVLQDWRTGCFQQRHSVTDAETHVQKRRAQPAKEISVDRATTRRTPKRPSTLSRKFVKLVDEGGSVHYLPNESSAMPEMQKIQSKRGMPNTKANSMRPAQLEINEVDQGTKGAFHARKRFLDHLYRNQSLPVPALRTMSSEGIDIPTPSPESTPSSASRLGGFRDVHDQQTQASRPLRRRKSMKPRRLDVESAEYRHAKDPLSIGYYSPGSPKIHLDKDKSRIQGLGPYGTKYTHHFDIFPLDTTVYFHETTLVGSGVIDASVQHDLFESSSISRPRISFDLGQQTLRWGLWDSELSSELGIVLDFVFEQLEAEGDEARIVSGHKLAVDATMFILKYVKGSIYFSDKESMASFAVRVLECVGSFDKRIKIRQQQLAMGSRSTLEVSLAIYDRLLVVILTVLELCRREEALLSECFQLEDLLRDAARTSLSTLNGLGTDDLKRTFEDLRMRRFRERGLREDAHAIHSWVVVMQILEVACIPRASFWELAQTIIVPPQVGSSTDASHYERVWQSMFYLLPLTEFNRTGVIIPGHRRETAGEGWVIPQKLLRRVFQLYEENERQPAGFIDYCKALVGRCHWLVQQWSWRRSMPVVGIIFDFFGAQDLAHLHNEEGYESPRFLQELSRSPTLDVEPNDKCYHIFLKLVGLSIRRLREVGAINDIRNLVVRTTPNHNRQHLKEQNVHTRDLAALRNHHDLLATLFWASPAELRPKVSQIEDLVNPESSHKEACLINIRSWGQLARFVVAAGEATTSFRPFSRWRNVFFQRVLRQLDSVASDVQQQVLSLSKDANNTISEVLINDTVSRNRAAVMDVVYASVSESFHVMREAVDLESASFSMNMPQLQSVFRKFCISQPELDWAILRAALDTLDSFLDRVDEFRENEESQQSESRILHSAQADDALMNLEHELSATFFLMARSLLSSQDERMASPITRKSKSDCLEHMVMLAARLGSMLSSSGAMELPDMFAAGRYGLFDGPAHKLDLSQRHYLVLFLQTLLKHDPGSLFDASFNLIELWALALVKPREFLGYENKLAQQLHRSGANFVPDGVVGLTVTPAYSTNRDMLEFAVSQMRRSIRDAGPSRRQGLMEKHSKTLQLLMEQIKGDLHITSLDASGHHSYVIFIQSVVSLIKAHGSEIRPVDNFFYQVSKEYSPSVQDPQLHVAGLVSYGLRLLEGDTRSGQQLFYLLHSNLKFAMINDKLRQEVIMLKSGMKNRGISNFILGKMMPAVIRATFNNSSAFPIMDVYAKLLSLHLAGKTAPYEMGADDLPNIAVILRASMEGMGSWGRHDMMLSAANVHFLRQLIAVLNLLWPSIDVMSWSVDVSSPDWKEISKSCEMMQKILTNADGYLDGLLNAGTSLNTAASKLLLRGSSHSPSHQFGSDIRMFTDNIVEDIAKNWVVSTHRIIIQTPAGSRGREAAQGMAMPSWDMTRLLRDLQGRTRGWCSWWERVFGNSPCGQWNMPESPLF